MGASVALLGLSSLLAGTVVEVLPLDEMTARADVVVRARVIETRVEEEPRDDGRGVTGGVSVGAAALGAPTDEDSGASRQENGRNTRAIKYTTLEVVDAIKGAAIGERVVVYQPGRRVLGAHEYRAGEELVFFGVRHARKGRAVVVGLSLGVGLFIVRPAGGAGDVSIEEQIGDVADVRTGRAPVARAFASWRAFVSAATQASASAAADQQGARP